MQYAALHGPKRYVSERRYISLANARKQGYHGPRYCLKLECGHEVWREQDRGAARVKCGECLGPGYNTKGFKRET